MPPSRFCFSVVSPCMCGSVRCGLNANREAVDAVEETGPAKAMRAEVYFGWLQLRWD